MIKLRWLARDWELRAPVFCVLFGHIWKSDKEYMPLLHPFPEGPDKSSGHHIVSLSCKCTRCGSITKVGYVRDWSSPWLTIDKAREMFAEEP